MRETEESLSGFNLVSFQSSGASQLARDDKVANVLPILDID